ncbi:FAD-binding oxidoreductase [Spirillospora sp. CA-294931]|uniref:FAD-binding oxidoreductase n=1 Tax=Spirillospora sp. CA-294931 TaxID=3240042 RepID=UPI003D8E3BE9
MRLSVNPSAPSASPADWNAFARGLDGRLVRPDDAAYDRARQLHMPRYDAVRPAGIAYVETPQDVTECIGFASRMRLPVAVRSGGHNYAGWSTGTGLVIDVSPMDAVQAGSGRAVVGAGTRLIDVYDRLAAGNVSIPAGSCPTVGVAGLTLGGGVGVTSRAYGLTCDVLESVTVVTADGKVRVCDSDRERDLFWACRGGGGGNFGVAVEFTFRTHAVGDVTFLELRWPWPKAADVLRGWQRRAPEFPDEVWTNVRVTSAPGEDSPAVGVMGVSLADPERSLEALVAGIGAEPSERNVESVPYLDAMKMMAGCPGQSVAECHARGDLPGQREDGRFPRADYAAKSHLAHRPLPDDAVRALLARFTGGGQVGGRTALLDPMGGAIGRVAPGATAFPHRAALFSAQYLADADDLDWLRGTHRAMEPFMGGTAYVNHMDPELENWQRAYYGANLPRLTEIKAAYDPQGLFRFPQAVTSR